MLPQMEIASRKIFESTWDGKLNLHHAMSRKQTIFLAIVFTVVVGGAAAWWHYSVRHDNTPAVFANELSRLDELKRQTEIAMRDYVPRPVSIDDVTAPMDVILRQHPCVGAIDRNGPPNPKRRVIHFRDWHLVNKDAFKIDIEQDGKTHTADEIERLYLAHIVQVEMVQLEQMTVLRTLQILAGPFLLDRTSCLQFSDAR